MSLNEIWENLKFVRENEGIEKLCEPIIIPNSFNHKEYTLTHKFKDSTSAFIGFDEANAKYHIKIFGVPLYNQVKSIYKNLKLVGEYAEDLKLISVIDIIEFYENDR